MASERCMSAVSECRREQRWRHTGPADPFWNLTCSALQCFCKPNSLALSSSLDTSFPTTNALTSYANVLLNFVLNRSTGPGPILKGRNPAGFGNEICGEEMICEISCDNQLPFIVSASNLGQTPVWIDVIVCSTILSKSGLFIQRCPLYLTMHEAENKVLVTDEDRKRRRAGLRQRRGGCVSVGREENACDRIKKHKESRAVA